MPAATTQAASLPPTPVLSVRRLPLWLQRSAAQDRLAVALQQIMGGPTPPASCLVVDQGSRQLFALRADDELVPASNMKLITMTAVLDKLGPATRFVTTVTASSPPSGGVVAGDLYLVGGGDPLLRTPAYAASFPFGDPVFTSLSQLAAEVRSAGITQVKGSVIGDDSRYDNVRGVPTWNPVYQAEGDAGPLSALDVNDGLLYGDPGISPGASPAVQSAQLFTQLLKGAGVKVLGAAGAGRSPAGSPTVARIQSAPLDQVVGEVLRESDNTGAELLTKELGLRFAGSGSTAAGISVIRSDLAADGLPVSQLVQLDGSGLDTGDRVTCGLLAAVLSHAGPAGPLAGDLPVAGQSGTLRFRLVGTDAAGRVVAKTGTLDAVSALSGFVRPTPREAALGATLDTPLTFSLLLNGLPGYQAGVDIGNRVAEALAQYPVVPALGELEPQR